MAPKTLVLAQLKRDLEHYKTVQANLVAENTHCPTCVCHAEAAEEMNEAIGAIQIQIDALMAEWNPFEEV